MRISPNAGNASWFLLEQLLKTSDTSRQQWRLPHFEYFCTDPVVHFSFERSGSEVEQPLLQIHTLRFPYLFFIVVDHALYFCLTALRSMPTECLDSRESLVFAGIAHAFLSNKPWSFFAPDFILPTICELRYSWSTSLIFLQFKNSVATMTPLLICRASSEMPSTPLRWGCAVSLFSVQYSIRFKFKRATFAIFGRL